MKQYVTRYKTENGKTHKVEDKAPPKGADEKNGAPGNTSGAGNKNESGNPAK